MLMFSLYEFIAFQSNKQGDLWKNIAGYEVMDGFADLEKVLMYLFVLDSIICLFLLEYLKLFRRPLTFVKS